MEQAGEVGAFVQIAVDAGQAKVARIIRAAVFPGADVFDVQRGQRRVILVKLAVFAAVPGAVTDELPDRFGQGMAPAFMRCASRRKTATNLFALT